jgi:hypothetical protein
MPEIIVPIHVFIRHFSSINTIFVVLNSIFSSREPKDSRTKDKAEYKTEDLDCFILSAIVNEGNGGNQKEISQ